MSKLSATLRRFSNRYKIILVTGGAGAIGSDLVCHLLSARVKRVIVIDDLSSGYKSNIPKDKRVVFIKGDITNHGVVKKAFEKYGKVDIVYHLAAHFANQNSIEHPVRDLQSNGVGTINLLEFSLRNKVKRFIYFSTSCIYKSKNQKLRESDLDLQFDTPYAISKYIGEKYAHFYHNFYNLPIVTLRIFNSFGPGERPGLYRNVIPNFFYKSMLRESLVITGTGNETRNFTFVDDIVRGALLAALSPKAPGHTINLGSKKSIAIKKLAKMINKLTGNKKEIIYKPRRRWDHSTSRRGSLELAEKLLGFKAEIPFEMGLAKTYKFFHSRFKKNL